MSEAEMLQVKEKEGKKILAKIKDQEYVFALAIEGKIPPVKLLPSRSSN